VLPVPVAGCGGKVVGAVVAHTAENDAVLPPTAAVTQNVARPFWPWGESRRSRAKTTRGRDPPAATVPLRGQIVGRKGQDPGRAGVCANRAIGRHTGFHQDVPLAGVTVDGIVWDVDGVLLDARGSYPLAVVRAVDTYCRQALGEPSPLGVSDVAVWKAAGGFNDDWELAQAVACLLTDRWLRGDWPVTRAGQEDFCRRVAALGGGMAAVQTLCPEGACRLGAQQRAQITRWAMQWYGGIDGCRTMFGMSPGAVREPGLFHREQPLLRPQELECWRGRLGIFTGRNRGELVMGLHQAGLTHLFPAELCRTVDEVPAKPDPTGLVQLAERLGGQALAYVGDNPDDWEAARRYGTLAASRGLPALVFCAVTLGDREKVEWFGGRRVDCVGSTPQEVLRWLRPRSSACVAGPRVEGEGGH